MSELQDYPQRKTIRQIKRQISAMRSHARECRKLHKPGVLLCVDCQRETMAIQVLLWSLGENEAWEPIARTYEQDAFSRNRMIN